MPSEPEVDTSRTESFDTISEKLQKSLPFKRFKPGPILEVRDLHCIRSPPTIGGLV
ncbi:MAG TPA: hypothetical protein VGY56_09070 [Verrucomicrobiae bacterium]|nr:hypothetical protein [Verrucomicrobiae bacterium]